MKTLFTPQSACSDQSAPAVREHVAALLEYAAANPLDTEGAWRLSSETCRTLTQHTGATPRGGWAALAGLCAGPFLNARARDFEPNPGVELPSEPQLRAMLLNSFTRNLIPPSAAAGLFLILGIHPAWGLRLAHQFTGEDAPPAKGWSNTEVFPPENFDVLADATFGFISDLLAQLRSLDAWTRYPLDELGKLIRELAIKGHSTIERRRTANTGVPQLVSEHDLSNHRIRDCVSSDLLDSVLIPAGAARTFEDRTFCLVPNALEGVDVPESVKASAA
jgi:hypothetical protein